MCILVCLLFYGEYEASLGYHLRSTKQDGGWRLHWVKGEGNEKKKKTYIVLFMMTVEMEICPSEKG